MNDSMNRSSIIRQTLTRLSSPLMRTGRRSVVLGAVLLAASSVTVLATANTRPTITNATLSRSVLNEGERVTLSLSFTDPDVMDFHAVRIRWADGQPTQQFSIPFGQTSFQVSHAYVDDNEAPDRSKQVRVTLYDRQSPPGSEPNDNGGDGSPPHPYRDMPIQVKNVAPGFVSQGIRVTKKGASRVVVEGDVTDPGSADRLQVTAGWGDPTAPGTTACGMSSDSRHFVCEHAYRPNLQPKTYPIALKVTDDEGASGYYRTTVQLP